MLFRPLLLGLCAFWSVSMGQAQDLEPRAYVNTPVGMNFAVIGYGYTEGDVLQDAAAPVKDARISANATFMAYARSLNLWGDSGKIDVVVPYVWVDGHATFAGQEYSRRVEGLGDPAVRLTWNFIGAPALTLQEYMEHHSDWIVGGSFRVGLPLGQYDKDKLLNIGANRWSFKPELGVSKNLGRWSFETSAGVTVFTDNNQFFGDGTREQDPIFALQGHLIYSFANGIWAGVDGTYYLGGRTTVNGVQNDDQQSNTRLGLTLAVPLSIRQSLKIYGSIGATARAGGDFTTGGIAWQYRWGAGLPSSRPAP